jgi:hypothetical protein
LGHGIQRRRRHRIAIDGRRALLGLVTVTIAPLRVDEPFLPARSQPVGMIAAEPT